LKIIFETKSHVTLTLTNLLWPWRSYLRECLIVLNKYHYLVCGCTESDCGRTNGHFYRVY